MEQIKYVIKDNAGIHARPAGLLVKLAKEFESSVTIEKDGKTADARKILAVMSLGAKKDDEITVKIDGNDAEEAASKIKEFLENNL